MPNVNFTLSSNNKHQLRDFYNYLNQKVITAINTLYGSKLEDNLITNHQIDYMPSSLFKLYYWKNQEHPVANKVGSIMLLV